MTTTYLQRIILRLPGIDPVFANGLVQVLSGLGQQDHDVFCLTRTRETFFPQLCLDFHPADRTAQADFSLSNGQVLSVPIANETGTDRASPFSYQLLDLPTVTQRLDAAGASLRGIDHLGFNLPWFSTPLHPRIPQLRTELAPHCLYHHFPTGEPWDFILPGTLEEMVPGAAIDYHQCRRPKFEIVSFSNCSTPLIQLDVEVPLSYEQVAGLFPEGLQDATYRYVWVYLKNSSAVDICLVLNEVADQDWSPFFQGCRL